MNRRMHALLIVSALVCTHVGAAASPALAQDFRGAITGRIRDGSGLPLPGATVTVTNTSTNIASTTVTNGEGIYTVTYLNPGPYRLTAELQGFKKLQRDNIDVRIGDRIT